MGVGGVGVIYKVVIRGTLMLTELIGARRRSLLNEGVFTSKDGNGAIVVMGETGEDDDGKMRQKQSQ